MSIPSKAIEEDLRDDKAGAFLDISGHDIPGRVFGARFVEAFLVRLLIPVPECALLHIGVTKLPVMGGFVQTLQKARLLLFLREVQKDFDDPRPVEAEAPLEIIDRAIPLLPDFLEVMRRVGNRFAFENAGVHPDDQNFLVVRSVEDRDAPALGQISVRPPEKVVFEFDLGGRLEAVDATAPED